MIKKLFLFLLVFFLLSSLPAFAQNAGQDTYIKGQVLSANASSDANEQEVQALQIKLLSGAEAGKTVVVQNSIDPSSPSTKFSTGDSVILDQKVDPASHQTTYGVYEQYRLDGVWWILGIFFAVLILVIGWRGLGAIIGLLVSLGIIGAYIVPQIVNGADPLQTCLTGAVVILLITTYIAHGMSLRTSVAVVATGIALVISVICAVASVSVLHLSGIGSEDIYNLQVGMAHPINASGLLLGGLLIGTLGALNDITTTQVITLFTFIEENPAQTFASLFKKGMLIGREHITSLINTLVLAYAGTSLAVFIFFALNPQHLPWWVIVNNEATVEEITRSIVGSLALILVVPVSTFLAVLVGTRGLTFSAFFPSPASEKKRPTKD